jgi:hypothetical protein
LRTERSASNAQAALKRHGIIYPVAQEQLNGSASRDFPHFVASAPMPIASRELDLGAVLFASNWQPTTC